MLALEPRSTRRLAFLLGATLSSVVEAQSAPGASVIAEARLDGGVPAVLSVAPRTHAHRLAFMLTNAGTVADSYHLQCVGLGKVTCVATSALRVSLAPGQQATVEVEYAVGAPGRGLVGLLVFSETTRADAFPGVLVHVNAP
jgi:hypothetical protein